MLNGRLAKTLVCANGKGGVGKTSLTAGIGAYWSKSIRVLLVDLDPQGNLTRDDLGVEGDDGVGLFKAVTLGERLEPVPARRSIAGSPAHLDVVTAGRRTRQAADFVTNEATSVPDRAGFLARALAPLVGEYDLLLVDTPPSGSSALTDAALGCARWLVVPTKADEGSIRGIEDLIRRTVTTTPEDWGPIDILGAALFGVTRAATNVASSARRQLDEWGGGELRIFDTIIPHSDRAAVDLRAMHLLPEEYSALAARSRASRLAALKDGRDPGTAVSQSAGDLARAYATLVGEVHTAMTAGDRR